MTTLQSLDIEGCYIFNPEIHSDERGLFVKHLEQSILRDLELDISSMYLCTATNLEKGTLRGLHFQESPFEETKIVRCSQGECFDVLVDFRPKSDTYLKWVGINLKSESFSSIIVSPGIAHGYITLTDNCVLEYFICGEFNQDAQKGIRWNDPAVSVNWPLLPTVVSSRDAQFPLLNLEVQ
ncbi:MAG: dTDP-4-dehydrorhamnose 3,5-epimerase family protein [Acidimicrobiales bacterium]|nr:dTDP-4-dehydrorhamnose 3,5-epimerase family protein [Acidimicrobiales bacterium]